MVQSGDFFDTLGLFGRGWFDKIRLLTDICTFTTLRLRALT
jgi:hypothetical protein